MKILLINNHFKIIGGTERYFFDLGTLLESRGHQVAYFSTLDKGNQKSKWSKYFVKKLDFNKKSFTNSIDKFPKIFYSFEARRKISLLLNDFKPDIVHLHNIYYYISPSILGEIKKRKIPIVQTVHDYQLISPSIIMFHNDQICEIAKKTNFYKAIFHKCVKGSYIATFMSVIVLYFQNLDRFYEKGINIFITPSLFLKQKLIEYGLDKNKIVHQNNFVNIPRPIVQKKLNEKYVLFFGRICEAKGVFLLLKAIKRLPDIKFKIAGNFESEKIKILILQKVESSNIKNVEFLGFSSGKTLTKLIKESSFTVVPSLWFENQPYSILESYTFGKTVIASNLGALPEIVRDGKEGLLFKAGDSKDLATKISYLWRNPKLAKTLGVKGLRNIQKKFNSDLHYKNLMKIYNKALDQ